MKVFGLVLPLLACGALAVDYNTILADLKVISSLTTTLDNDVKAVQPSFVGLPSQLQVQSDAVLIHKKLLNATSDLQASSAFGTAGSNAVYNALVSLAGQVNTTLADTVAMKASFGELTPVVLASLEALKDDTITFSLNTATKFDPNVSLQAVSLLNQINTAYNNAIVAYGGNPNNAPTAGLPTIPGL